MNQTSLNRWKIVVASSGLTLAWTALAALAAWIAGDFVLIQLNSQFAPVHYNAALGILLWGLALIAVAIERTRLTHLSGILLVVGATLSSANGLHLEQWAFRTDPSLHSFPRNGVDSIQAITLGLAGFALLLIARPGVSARKSIVITLIGAAISTGGISSVIGFQPGTSSGVRQGPPLLAVLASIIGGLGILVCALRPGERPLAVIRLFPVLVGLSGIAVSLTLWQAFARQWHARLEQIVQSETLHVNHLLEHDLPVRLRSLIEAAERGNRDADGKNPEFQRQPGFLGFARVDSTHDIHWLEESSGFALPRSLAEMGAAELLGPVLRDGKSMVARTRWHGTRILLVYVPYSARTPSEGGRLGVLKLTELFDSILNPNIAPGYAVAVTSGDEVIYERFAAETHYQGEWQQSLSVRFHDLRWKVHVWPTQEVMGREDQSLPRLTLMVGVLTTILLTLAVYLAQTARRRTCELEQQVQERKQAEVALRQSEAKYRSLIENLEQGIFLKNRDRRYVAVNSCFCAGIDRSETDVIGKSDADLFGEAADVDLAADDRQVLVEGKKTEREEKREFRGKRQIVRRILTPVKDAEGRVVGVLGICWDVTEQRAIEARLRQSSKMDAIGQLAGGIAHDFNNLLTAILGNLDLMLADLRHDEQNRLLALSAQSAASRAASLTSRLLGFSRQHHCDRQPTDLRAIVDEVITLLSRTIDPAGHRLESSLGGEEWMVQADPGQINQVLMNLCLNARDAMAGAGRIGIEAAHVEIDEVEAHLNPAAKPGGYVRLRVSDTGSGMPPEVRARIFEPFFTTKEVGKGTGLGLAMVFGIVKQHQGWVECYSEVDRGTRFDIFLPRSTVAAPIPAAAPQATPKVVTCGKETILIADDEAMIRRLASTVLKRQGYNVLEAEDGEQAVEIYRREYPRIDLVMLDLTMPKLSGREAFRELRNFDPEVKVLFASGFAAEEISKSEEELILGFVKKPYRPNELVQVISDVLTSSMPRPVCVDCADHCDRQLI